MLDPCFNRASVSNTTAMSLATIKCARQSHLVLPLGLRMPSTCYREDVRLQKAGEEAHQEAERGSDGSEREADLGEGQ